MAETMVTRQVFAQTGRKTTLRSPQWDPNIATQSSKYLIVKWQVQQFQTLGTFRHLLTLS